MPTKSKRKVAKRKTQGGRRRAAAGPREHLHRLVEELPETEIGMAERFLVFLHIQGDPCRLGVEEVDEPLSAEEIAGIEEGRREYLEGKSIPWEVARQRLADG